MITPSTLDLTQLFWLPLHSKSAFPSQPAVYFCIDAAEKVLYIGRSKNARVRWSRHHKYEVLKAIAHIKVSYLFVDSMDHLPSVEEAMIRYFNPPLVNSILKNQPVADLRAKEAFKRWSAENKVSRRSA